MKKLVYTLLILVFVFLLNCDVLINPEPNIFVYQGSTEIPENSDIVNFGRIEVGMSHSLAFKILNKGKKELLLNGSPILMGYNNEDAFQVVTHPETIIKPGESTTFTIKFSPTESKLCQKGVMIYNTDKDKSGFLFRIRGTGIVPDIIVRQDDQIIPIDIGVYDFGNVYRMYSSDEVVFTIENIGNSQLELTGTQNYIEISGSDAPLFKINQTMTTTPIAPGGTTTFTIIFSPTSLGVKTAIINIANNDPEEDPFIFTVKGNGIAKEPTFDFNGDGIADIIVGSDSDKAYIFFGIENPPSEIKASKADVLLESEYKHDQFGIAVSIAGDFNNDGFDDVIIGAPDYKVNEVDCGCVYIFFGEKNPQNEIKASNANIKIIGPDLTRGFGRCISDAGDINNDGFDDIMLGNIYGSNIPDSPFSVYIFLGGSSHPSDMTGNDADITLTSTANHDGFGAAFSSAGDFNNDGYDDVIIGASNSRTPPSDCVYIFFGKENLSSVIYTDNADVIINDDVLNNTCEFRVSSAGDFNNDGFDDVIFGSDSEQGVYEYLRTTFIFFGCDNPIKFSKFSEADVKICGEYEGHARAWAISELGDINIDGFDDVIFTDRLEVGSSKSSNCQVFYGSKNPDKEMLSSDADINFVSASFDKYRFGMSLSSAGDFNFDGYVDILIGSDRSHINGFDSGSSHIFYGKAIYEKIYNDTDDVTFIGEKELSYFGVSVSGGR